MRIAYTRRAVADIVAIADYIKQHNPDAGLRVEQAIKRTISYLASNPGLGINRPDLGMRKIGVPRFAYSIYYRVGDAAIKIIHIRDERRRPLQEGDLS